jgi:predicted DNA repair protein MutK
LSIEIVIIALGTVSEQSLLIRIVTVSAIAVLATIGVYGIVAMIVRMDDAGYKLIKTSNNKGFFLMLGTALVKSLPVIIKLLSVIGTIALILVSGGIFIHNIEYLHHLLPGLPSIIKEIVIGFAAGLAVAGLVTAGKRIFSMVKQAI